MPFEITFDNLPTGYAASSARGAETIAVSCRGFVSSEDGNELIKMLEGIPQGILSRLPGIHLPSMVHSLLAVIRPDKTATIYLNEVRPIGTVRIKGKCEKGDLITTDKILDMGRLSFPNVSIGADAGIVYVFSSGWRKGLFYDLIPLQAAGQLRDYDLEEVLGSLHSYLAFQERFKIDEASWARLLEQRWFPFVHLDNDLLREMIAYAKEGWPIDDLLPRIASCLLRLLSKCPLDVTDNPAFTDHGTVFTTAVERYRAGDHISCASILYPRIEGALRAFHRAGGYTTVPSAEALTRTAIEHHEQSRISESLLLPEKFHAYLDNVYFAHFAPGTAPDVGRHSVAHGEARSDDFSLKSSTIGFLIIYQLSLFFSDGSRK